MIIVTCKNCNTVNEPKCPNNREDWESISDNEHHGQYVCTLMLQCEKCNHAISVELQCITYPLNSPDADAWPVNDNCCSVEGVCVPNFLTYEEDNDEL